jgi:transcriptional regulator with XRE-family HTH domain
MRTIRAKGQRIAMLREAQDITQEELSARAGYSVKTLWKAEAGRRLRRRTLEDIATALGVSIADVAWSIRRPIDRERVLFGGGVLAES